MEKTKIILLAHAWVVKLVDTWDLKSHGLKSRVGSTPTLGTIYLEN